MSVLPETVLKGDGYRRVTTSRELLFMSLPVAGFVSGNLVGWSKVCNYWFSPILKIIGPVPSAAWLPIAVALMPTLRAAGLFLIATAVWFPLTLGSVTG